MIIHIADTWIEGTNRLPVETEIPEIRATRDLMKVCSEGEFSTRTRGELHLDDRCRDYACARCM